MRRLLALAGFLGLLALAGLAGAGVYQLLDDDGRAAPETVEVPEKTPEPGDLPRLSREEAANLIRTHMSTDQELSRTCLLIFSPTDQATALRRDLAASYVGDGLWIVSNELCTFAVSDDTGTVTGP